MPDLITDHERAYYPGAAQDALRQARQEIAELQDALDQAEAELSAARAAHQADRERIVRLCNYWGRAWNDMYDKASRAHRGKVAYHLIGTAVWALRMKFLSGEDAPTE